MQTGFIVYMYNHEDPDPHPLYKTDLCKIEKVNVQQSGSMLTVAIVLALISV